MDQILKQIPRTPRLAHAPVGVSSRSRTVLVVGAGVSGLTTALCLGRRGFTTVVLADRFSPHVTSNVAGALWEWPPAVCGHQFDQASLERSKAWCETSYAIFSELSLDPATGVHLRPVTFYFSQPIGETPRALSKMEELRVRVANFRHDRALIAENEINPALGLRDAYSYLAPMVDTDTYMHWLMSQALDVGCRFVERKITGALREQEADLRREFDARTIVNCSGLGAAELAEDEVRPLRGALVRVRNDGRTTPRITQAHCISHTAGDGEEGFIFILPRGDERLVLGGFAELNQSGLDIGLHNHEPVRAMYRRCVEFLPALQHAVIDADEPVRVGLRPFRKANVRLEQEPNTRIIHNYGHGGSGVSFSWGTSLEATELVEALVAAGIRIRQRTRGWLKRYETCSTIRELLTWPENTRSSRPVIDRWLGNPPPRGISDAVATGRRARRQTVLRGGVQDILSRSNADGGDTLPESTMRRYKTTRPNGLVDYVAVE
ncbi:MAG: D-amino acid oxidase Aao 1 [Planctomycetota bacterium]|nr:D-amino acid oxidase Aao 1 [Planctomycetota bacterium]